LKKLNFQAYYLRSLLTGIQTTKPEFYSMKAIPFNFPFNCHAVFSINWFAFLLVRMFRQANKMLCLKLPYLRHPDE